MDRSDKKKIGICWRSGMLSLNRNDSYSSLLDWKELLTDDRFQIVNMQYGDCEDEILEAEKKYGIEILRFADLDLKNDLDSVVALASKLDVVVTVMTSVSELTYWSGTQNICIGKRSWSFLGTNKFPWSDKVKWIQVESNEIPANKIPDAIQFIEEILDIPRKLS